MSVVGNQPVISVDVRPICYPNPVETTLYVSTANAIQWQLFDVQGCVQASVSVQYRFFKVSARHLLSKLTQ